MEGSERRIFPRSSAFEGLLAKVELDLWQLRDNPLEFSLSVAHFVRCRLPSRYRNKIMENSPDLLKKLEELEKRIKMLEDTKSDVDPFTEEMIDKQSIPAESGEFAEEVWHAVADVLEDAGFYYPMTAVKHRARMRA